MVNPKPNIQAANKIEFTHNRQLIFPAGNEYHKFEILDVHIPTLNVDRMEWFDPYYHATLYPNQTARNYLYDEDQNGAFIIRNSDDEDVATTCDYVFTHFTLKKSSTARRRSLPERRMDLQPLHPPNTA